MGRVRRCASIWSRSSSVSRISMAESGKAGGADMPRHHKWPQIEGLHDFKGHITHSADWDHGYDYSGKRIAVIGNGSSGIQIVPQLAKLPGTDVTNFIRGPTWIYYRVPPSRHLGRETDDPNPEYTEEERTRWRNDPAALREYRRAMIHRTNKAFKMVSQAECPQACEENCR